MRASVKNWRASSSAAWRKPVGYVLPIRRRQHEGRLYWSSQLWFLRPERLLLMQGDSPIGYRLPLDSLPWVAPDDIEYDYEERSVRRSRAAAAASCSAAWICSISQPGGRSAARRRPGRMNRRSR